ncbi:MAG TPA: hypothetical protein VG963_07090, partial [Polyangiaceae bacterium]|nr:hypothetical protein [Polyangiaceae bacterium]
TLPAPLPNQVFIEHRVSGWAFAPAQPELGFRRHSPGGANQLYDGEPLLIVYGTQGPADIVHALKAAAEVASHSCSAAWPAPNGEKGSDGVSHNQNLYGDLLIKADREVTAEDIAQRHLVLLGSAAQNAVVARLAPRLPVQLDDRAIRFSDGLELAASDRALGLVHYNPDAPTRLIFWVASDRAEAYRTGSLVAELLGAPLTGADAVVTRVSDPALVASRSFDSAWHWLPRAESPLLPRELASSVELERAIARTVLRAAPADFALAGLPQPSFGSAFEPGEARLVDLVAHAYFEPIGVMTLRGSELLGAAHAVAAAHARLEPEAALGQIHPEREYRLALSAPQISPFVALTHLAPLKYRLSDSTVARALARYGVSPAPAQPANAPTPPAPAHPAEAGNTSASAR